MLLNKIIGQENAVRILTALYNQKHYPPLLFYGPRGVGKRTTAISFAQLINCPIPTDLASNQCQRCQQIGNLTSFAIKLIFPIATRQSRSSISDYQSEDGSVATLTKESQKALSAIELIGENLSKYALGQMRPVTYATNYHPIEIMHWLRTEMAYKPIIGSNKVIIIIDADRMRHDAANALLKTLEEPQKDTLFILTTERLANILPTIRSRCQVVRFSYLAKSTITDYLINKKNISPQLAQLAAEVADGSLRKAIDFSSLLAIQKLLNLETETYPVDKIITSLLFIYRKALQLKLSIPVSYQKEIIKKIATDLTIEQITSRVAWLLNILNDIEINLNRKLLLFSIYSAVRF
ncbi:MAG: hypothetical protein ABIK19_01155 [candidate division WOR-3 bacterium]